MISVRRWVGVSTSLHCDVSSNQSWGGGAGGTALLRVSAGGPSRKSMLGTTALAPPVAPRPPHSLCCTDMWLCLRTICPQTCSLYLFFWSLSREKDTFDCWTADLLTDPHRKSAASAGFRFTRSEVSLVHSGRKLSCLVLGLIKIIQSDWDNLRFYTTLSLTFIFFPITEMNLRCLRWFYQLCDIYLSLLFLTGRSGPVSCFRYFTSRESECSSQF